MFPLEIPIAAQDGIIVVLFVAAAGFLLYKKLRKKAKSCPACEGSCGSTSHSALRPNQS